MTMVYYNFFGNSCLWNTQKSKAREFRLAKFQARRLQLIILDISKPLRNFRIWKDNNGLDSMPQYQPCIPEKWSVVIKIFTVLMLDVFSKADSSLVQRCNNDIGKTLWIWGCCYNVVWTLPLQHSWYAMRWIQQGSIGTTLWNWYRTIDVVKTLWIWRLDLNVARTLSIQHS